MKALTIKALLWFNLAHTTEATVFLTTDCLPKEVTDSQKVVDSKGGFRRTLFLKNFQRAAQREFKRYLNSKQKCAIPVHLIKLANQRLPLGFI